jgi:phosphatidylglycerophosphate synthase
MTASAQATSFQEAARTLGVTGRSEARLLRWLAARIPPWIGPDHLTALGFASTLAAAALYATSARWPWLVLLVNVALAGNWFGDSLDGTLARFRQCPRPRYGFYVDHLLDSVGAVALLGGLALSGLMAPALAIAVLVAYLLVSAETFLATYTLGRFTIAHAGIGGTELRIVLAAANMAAFFLPAPLVFGLRLFDVLGALAAVGLSAIVVIAGLRNGRRLYAEETRPRS